MSTERDSTGAVLVDPLGGLLLDPSNELRFKGPFDDYVTVSLSIKNPTEKRIAFKIKTTAPKRYCVKPNSGVLDPSQSMKVNVLLQPFNYDPSEKNKHKFMVQYLYLNDEEMQLSVNDILNMWKDVPQSRLLDLKLKCIFEYSDVENQKSNQQQVFQQDKQNQVQQQQQQQQKPINSQSASNRNLTTANNANETTNLNDFDSTLNNTTNINHNSNKSVSNSNSVNTNNLNISGSGAARVEKNDNTLNELKLVRQDNELLRKEISRLKEEESRLRKLALQSSSSAGSNRSSNLSSSSVEINSLADLLNNRLVLIIIVLTAIIVYLLLFR